MGAEEKPESHSGLSEEYLAKLEKMRLMDDTFFSEALDGKIDAVQYILDTTLERTDLKVVSTKAQYEYKSAVNRSIRLDIWAQTADGRVADIEIQRSDDVAISKRARFHGSMMDSRLLLPGDDYGKLVDRYVIFIMEKDRYGDGVPLYHLHTIVDEHGHADAEDGMMTVLVNGEFRDVNHPVGRLVHDFMCTDADDMYNPILAKEVRYMKETEGGREHMCRVMEELKEDIITEYISHMIELGYPDEEIANCLKVSVEKVAAIRSGKTA